MLILMHTTDCHCQNRKLTKLLTLRLQKNHLPVVLLFFEDATISVSCREFLDL
jgi:hypothetical protein